MVDGWDGHAGVALLLMETVELFEEVDFGTRSGFDGVQTLQTSLESERLERRAACIHQACRLSFGGWYSPRYQSQRACASRKAE